jgi:hypothetical protein
MAVVVVLCLVAQQKPRACKAAICLVSVILFHHRIPYFKRIF